MPVQGKEKFQSTAMKISVNDTGCYEKCVNLTNNHPRRYPPKNQCQLRNTFSHVVRIPQVNSKLDCQQNSLGTGDTPVQTFYSERERVEPS